MEKINNRTTRYGKNHFGCNLLEYDFNMDLDLTWTGIIKSLFELILNKLSLLPRIVRKSSTVVKQG